MRKLLYSSEQAVLVFFFFACGLYYHLGIEFRRPWELYATRVSSGFILYAVGILVIGFLLRLQDIRTAMRSKTTIPIAKTLQRYRKSYFNFPAVFEDLRLVHGVSAMFFVFIQLKHLIPLLNHAVHDEVFIASERLLFGGKLAGERLIGVTGTAIAPMLSEIYSFWYPYLAIAVVSLLLSRSSIFKQEFFLSFVLCWFIGILIVYAFPTWGPCFSAPETFSQLPLTRMTTLQAELWKSKLDLDANPHSGATVFLISGLPSLHLAAVLLCSVYLLRVQRILGIASWIFAALTAVATIYFGWHFVIDDIVAIPLVILAIGLGQRFVWQVEKSGR